MPSKTDIQLAHLTGEIEATQLVLVSSRTVSTSVTGFTCSAQPAAV